MRKLFLTGLLLVLLAVGVTGCGLLQEPAEPSEPIEAIPLETEEAAEEVVEETAETVEKTVEEAEPTAEMIEEEMAEEDSAEGASAEAAAVEGATIYTITPEGSLVRFELDEDLRGERITVVGTTDQVAGQISFDVADPASTEVGVLQINARGLATDNNFRNRAIQNEILDTGAYEFITFTPTSVDGLPDSVAVGDEVSFTITGDLTVREVTQPATFDVVATLVSDTEITGTASSVIVLTDYDINIPSVPSVANVEEEVELYIDFTATAS